MNAPLFKVGDRVDIRLSSYRNRLITECRGRLGPGGCFVYRVRLRKKTYVEVREDQLTHAVQREE